MATLPLGAVAQTNMNIGIETSDLDTTAHPGEDFYQYACGGWIKNIHYQQHTRALAVSIS